MIRSSPVALIFIVWSLGLATASSADDDSDRDDRTAESFAARWGLEMEADLETQVETDHAGSNTELSFDSARLGAGRGSWRTDLGLKWRADGGLLVEELAIRVATGESIQWTGQAGRTILPFVDDDWMTISDPLVAVLGETEGNALVFGTHRSNASLQAAAFRAPRFDDDDPQWIVATSAQTSEGSARIRAAWTSDLAESVGLRERREASRAQRRTTEDPSPVPGFAASAWMNARFVTLHVACVTSLTARRADIGVPLSPKAWYAQIGRRIARRWMLAAHFEGSRNLTEEPDRQCGGVAVCEISPTWSLALEAARGWFEDGAPSVRDRLTVQLGLEI